MSSFLWEALAAGLLIALTAGPLGSAMLWQRVSFFSDALAHASLLGVSLGIVLSINMTLTTLLVCLGFAVLFSFLLNRRFLPTDAALIILSQSAFAFGLLFYSTVRPANFSLERFLLGDILFVNASQLKILLASGVLCLSAIALIWKSLLMSVLHEEWAAAEGVKTKRVRLIFIFLIALFVAVSMPIVGILLLTALLVFPVASANPIAKSPEQMAIFASLIGALNMMLGLGASLHFDVPATPAIVAASSVTLLLFHLIFYRSRRYVSHTYLERFCFSSAQGIQGEPRGVY